MKYRALLVDPGNTTQERPVQILTNSLDDIKKWAYGDPDAGLEGPRGVLRKAVSADAAVIVYATEERQIDMLCKNPKPK